jgi:hypothetical protein
MKELLKAQELAWRNNEDAAVFAAYDRRRKRRRLVAGLATKNTKRRKKRDPEPGLTEKQRDDLDWREAEREARPVRAVGFFLP